MKVEISFKYLKKSSFVNSVLDSDIEKIKRKLQIFKKDDPVHLSVHIEKNPHKEEYYCRSHIYLPKAKTIVANEKSRNVTAAINKSFRGLSRQLAKVKTKLEKHLQKKRTRR
ncbi:MAG: HPF/RaiA family ribosome-associated protein [Candidatus Omnitrophica bacterium]|nr:HPF/RaiA family ribosome-associated protein [Candidatus Omnitrophota bacterium]MCF7893865.1 HPF/RaiA family ribosome-associated protein [Candidatus Omnitrophota bacterium]